MLLQEVANQVIAFLRQRANSPLPIGISTGLPRLDELFGGGLVRQQLSYLVGDSGVGKSWLASAFVLNGAKWLLGGNKVQSGYVGNEDKDKQAIANKEGKQPLIVFWSLEMAESPVVCRMLSQVVTHLSLEAEVNNDKVLQGKMSGEEAVWLAKAYDWLFALGQYVYMEFDARSVADMSAVLDALSQQYDIVLLVVDYFRLIEEVAIDGNMSTLQAERSAKLRNVAKHYDCHVLSLFDINREGQNTKGKPGLNNMRGGVAAQYDADLVVVLRPHEDYMDEKGNSKVETRLVLEVKKGRFVKKDSTELYARLGSGRIEMWKGEDNKHGAEASESVWGEYAGEGSGTSGSEGGSEGSGRGGSAGSGRGADDDDDRKLSQKVVGRVGVRNLDLSVDEFGRGF